MRRGDRVSVVDAVGHSNRERHHLDDEVVDLRGGVAGVQEHEQRRVVSRLDRPSRTRLIAFVLEHDQVVVAVTGEVHHVGTEPGDSIEEILRRPVLVTARRSS